MLEKLLRYSIGQRFVVIAAAALLIVVGLSSWQRLTLDAVPDVTANQVQINTDTGGLGPEEVERLVTFPIETAVSGLPRVTGVRSLSQFGLSQVTVTFEDAVDVYFARQLVSERLGRVQAELPAGVEPPQMGPVSTGLGDIYMFALESDARSVMDLRTIHDWQVAPQLRTVPGVAEVNAADGSEKQYQVVLDPQRMRGRNVSVGEIVEALQANNENAGGGVLDRNGERILIRSVGAATSLEDIERIPVKTEDGVPILVRDLADVRFGTPVLTGLSTKDGKQALVSIVMMLKGANGRTVAQAVDKKLSEIRSQLPKDVRLTSVYNRAELVNKSVATLTRNLIEGGLLVITVLVLLLGNLRGAVIAAVAIPMAMLFAIVGMERFGVSGNLMSLGAIDFGIIVDGAVIMVENCIRRLSEARARLGRALTKEEHREVVGEATSEVRKVTQFGEMIIIATFIPIFVLEGTAGKMFKPMALVFVLALMGALILSLTLIPTLCSLFLSRNTVEKRNVLMGFFERTYRPVLGFALRRRWLVIGGAAALVAPCGVLFTRLGSEFVPQLDEGDLVVQPIRMRTVNEEETLRLVTAAERKVREVPEVLTVFSRSGTPEVASDPMPLSLTDSFVMLRAREQWRPGMTKAKIQAEIAEKLEQVPGQGYNFSQPIQMRFAELASGVKADVGVRVVGEDLDVLRNKATEISSVIRSVSGAEDVEVEQVDEIPVMQVTLDREALSLYRVSVADVQRVVRTALGGAPVGQIVEGDKRFDLRLALPDAIRNDPDEIAALPIRTAVGETVPLATLARIGNEPAPAQIGREEGRRRVAIQFNVRGRDLGTTVADVQRAIRGRVELPDGYYVEYGGQFKDLQIASARLAIAVPFALALILGLLFVTFRSIRQALLIFSGVPLAVTGGVIALTVRGMPFSISAGVGFIALSGVAVLNGVVMVAAINRLREEGKDLIDVVREGAEQRLRPVLITALVAALGFMPMALNTGLGAEVQRPLATVVIGGIVSATMLTLLVLPALYVTFEREGNSSTG